MQLAVVVGVQEHVGHELAHLPAGGVDAGDDAYVDLRGQPRDGAAAGRLFVHSLENHTGHGERSLVAGDAVGDALAHERQELVQLVVGGQRADADTLRRQLHHVHVKLGQQQRQPLQRLGLAEPPAAEGRLCGTGRAG
eukprot:scaffold28740_cov67-Isochrysis_galbana.AAC.1